MLAGLVGATVVASVMHAGCYSATQIELRISTDVACDVVTAVGGAEIAVGKSGPALAADGQRETVAATTECSHGTKAGSLSLGTLIVVPSGGRDEAFVTQVVLRLPKRTTPCRPPDDIADCIVATRRARFIPHRALALPVDLSAACAGVRCGNEETCDRGRCVPSEVTTCPNDECSLAPADGGAPTDGSFSPDGMPSGDAAASETGDASDPDSGDAGGCPELPPPLSCPAQCGIGVRCCALMVGGVKCGADCGQFGNDRICSDDCQCGSGRVCSSSAQCGGRKFCSGSCDSLE